jgi:hypothetical protein
MSSAVEIAIFYTFLTGVVHFFNMVIDVGCGGGRFNRHFDGQGHRSKLMGTVGVLAIPDRFFILFENIVFVTSTHRVDAVHQHALEAPHLRNPGPCPGLLPSMYFLAA